MPDVDPTMGEPEKPPSRLEQIKYYTSLFLGALAIVCVFGFPFLVPFVLDPAISTIMHQFVAEPVHCNVSLVLGVFVNFFKRCGISWYLVASLDLVCSVSKVY